jgi:hypothetical protein
MIRRCDERDFELIWSLQIVGQNRTCPGRNCRMKSTRRPGR